MDVYCSSSGLLVSLSQLRVNYNGQENTCTWLHATTHGKFIFHSVRWKSSVLPVQSQSEQHILWQPLSVSVKGIWLAVSIEWVCFRRREESGKKKMLDLNIIWLFTPLPSFRTAKTASHIEMFNNPIFKRDIKATQQDILWCRTILFNTTLFFLFFLRAEQPQRKL